MGMKDEDMTGRLALTGSGDSADDRPRQHTRESVREAAFRLFGRHGYDGVSIDTIARAVGLSKGALYWHFEGKEALFKECLVTLSDLFREHIITPMEHATTPRERLDCFFHGVAALSESDAVAEGIAGYWQEPYNETMSRCFREHLEGLEESIRRPLQTALQPLDSADRLRPMADPETSSETLMALMEAMLMPLRRRSPALRRAILEDLRTTVLRAYTE